MEVFVDYYPDLSIFAFESIKSPPREAPTEQARCHGGKTMWMFNQKQLCSMSQISSQTAEQRRQQLEYMTSITKLYFRHASTLISHFNEWKDNNAFYFIELRLDMAYVSSSGLIAKIAHPPYYLGTIVRNSLQHPGLFGCECPHGHTAYAYTYSGSPLSGRVSQAMACPKCGWNDRTERRGWHDRSKALNATRAEDLERFRRLKESDPDFRPADLRDLLRSLEIPEAECVLPKIEKKIERSEDDGFIIQRDPYGGVKIEDTNSGRITWYQWNGIND